jgi:alanyl-tRNA synthetase
MDSNQIRKRFLDFFEKRGHKVIPSASLVPANDPSVLFNTAGMQPLVPYLLGAPHPLGKRLVNFQKCVRTQDIDEIGDNTHVTFFEMLGNWSFGDYFKEDAIKWSYELLTSKTEGFGLDASRLYITVFEGDENAPKDEASAEFWEKSGISKDRIYFMSAKSNWWSAGDSGPCGPDTEMFYDITPQGLGDLTKEQFAEADTKQKVVEIWNNVFMEYEKKDGKVIGKLKNRNVDTGMGLERIATVLQSKDNIFETDLFDPIISKIKNLAKKSDKKVERIVADHIRTAVFIIADGVAPSNTDRGYILRRLLRRAIRFSDTLQIDSGSLIEIAKAVVIKYSSVYPELAVNANNIEVEIGAEEQKFRETLSRGMKEFEKGTDAFTLFTTYGFPYELTEELAKEKGQIIDRALFEEKMKSHQQLSHTSSAGMFKGGLANQNEQTIKLHTAHHLLLSALQEVLGKEVKQRGSNITEERLRMDFLFPRKMTEEEKQKVESIVNQRIKSDLTVIRKEMPKIEAETLGAEMEFGAKYPDVVSIYFIQDKDGNAISKEFCGGPHVERTGVLGTFKIQKEEAVSAGVRRIKATLQ